MADRKSKAGKKAGGKDFVPDIVAFACNWCSYAGADTAGVNRLQYSPNFRVIRTMCSGRVTPGFVLKALKLGADGVLVSGCHFGDCHYIFGNYKAVEQFEKHYIRSILEQNRWSRTKTAAILEIDLKTLYRKMKRYKLE